MKITAIVQKEGSTHVLDQTGDILGHFHRLVGKLKDFQLQLHIDKNVKPIAQRQRPILFHVRKQLEA